MPLAAYTRLPSSRPYVTDKRPLKSEEEKKQVLRKKKRELLLDNAKVGLDLLNPCCSKVCCQRFLPADVLKAREMNLKKTEAELLEWVAHSDSILEIASKKQLQYLVKGERVCRGAWQRYHGVSSYKVSVRICYLCLSQPVIALVNVVLSFVSFFAQLNKGIEMRRKGERLVVRRLMLRESKKKNWAHAWLHTFFRRECDVVRISPYNALESQKSRTLLSICLLFIPSFSRVYSASRRSVAPH